MKAQLEKEVPIIFCDRVLAIREGLKDTFRFYCDFCKREHFHSAEEGHRVSHCDSGSPYEESGYILKEKK